MRVLFNVSLFVRLYHENGKLAAIIHLSRRKGKWHVHQVIAENGGRLEVAPVYSNLTDMIKALQYDFDGRTSHISTDLQGVDTLSPGEVDKSIFWTYFTDNIICAAVQTVDGKLKIITTEDMKTDKDYILKVGLHPGNKVYIFNSDEEMLKYYWKM